MYDLFCIFLIMDHGINKVQEGFDKMNIQPVESNILSSN